MSISFIAPTFERDVLYLDNLLLTLHNQTVLPLEIIIVDMNEKDWGVQETCDKYPLARRVSAPWTGKKNLLNVAWGINVGVKATSEQADYVCANGVEMMFSTNYVEAILSAATPELLFLAPCGFLPLHAPLDNVLEDWDELVSIAGQQERWDVPPLPWMDGTIKVTIRDWWFKYQGYDETLFFKPMSDNMNRRAVSSGLKRHIIPFHEAQALHQFHEPAWELIYESEADWEYFLRRCEMLVTNLNGWGELDGPRPSGEPFVVKEEREMGRL